MSETIRLGRVAGIAIGVHWSLVVIFVLVAAGLGFGRLPVVSPDAPAAAYAVAAIATAALFFLSVLAHELSHALVARHLGVGVEGIVLWLFGGVARLAGDPDDAAGALRIAIVGPLVSLVLGVAFLASAALAVVLAVPDLVVECLAWLGLINVVLAVFNLFPGAPLDGGRVLRAILWMRSGDRYGSWAQAARAGRVVGFAIIGLGLAQLAFLGVGGLWLVLIGWFLVSAAGAEGAEAELRGALRTSRVRDLMSPDPVTVPEGASVQDLLDDYVVQHRFTTFPVVDASGRAEGLVSAGSVRAVAPPDRPTTPVGSLMVPLSEVATSGPEEPVTDVLGRLGSAGGAGDEGGGRVLVLDARVPVGIVSPADVLRELRLQELGATAPGASSRTRPGAQGEEGWPKGT